MSVDGSHFWHTRTVPSERDGEAQDDKGKASWQRNPGLVDEASPGVERWRRDKGM